ncbi:MAG: hypothetical protein ACE14L_01485 [Terriglobales bacterium]
MDVRTGFFEKLLDTVADRLRDAAPADGLELSRYGARGLHFTLKRRQPAREVAVNFLGSGSFIHMGTSAIPVDVVDDRVAIRLTDSATMTVDQWADSMFAHLMKPEPAQAVAAAAESAPPPPKAAAKAAPRKGKK